VQFWAVWTLKGYLYITLYSYTVRSGYEDSLVCVCIHVSMKSLGIGFVS